MKSEDIIEMLPFNVIYVMWKTLLRILNKIF